MSELTVNHTKRRHGKVLSMKMGACLVMNLHVSENSTEARQVGKMLLIWPGDGDIGERSSTRESTYQAEPEVPASGPWPDKSHKEMLRMESETHQIMIRSSKLNFHFFPLLLGTGKYKYKSWLVWLHRKAGK